MKHKPVISPAILFSDKVIREAGTGRLSLINSFQRFHGREFPFAVPPFIVGVTFTGLVGKVDRLKLAVDIVDAEGVQIAEPVTAEVSSDVEVTTEETYELSFFIPSCQFAEPGVYQVRFSVGGDVIGQRALPATLLPPAEEAPVAAAKGASRGKPSRSPKNGKAKNR